MKEEDSHGKESYRTDQAAGECRQGDARAAEDHFMQVNGCSYAEMRAALGKANEDHRRRNRVPEWKLDISALINFM